MRVWWKMCHIVVNAKFCIPEVGSLGENTGLFSIWKNLPSHLSLKRGMNELNKLWKNLRNCLGRGTCIRLQPHQEKLASVFLVARWNFLFYLPVRIIVISFGSCIMTYMSSMLCGKFSIVHGSPNLYNLTSICIFSILFSLHFLRCW